MACLNRILRHIRYLIINYVRNKQQISAAIKAKFEHGFQKTCSDPSEKARHHSKTTNCEKLESLSIYYSKMRSKYQEIKDEAEKSPRKLTLHPGPKSEDQYLEFQVYSWIIEQRDVELAVPTTDIIDKRLLLNPRF